jgi:hypothetical protein
VNPLRILLLLTFLLLPSSTAAQQWTFGVEGGAGYLKATRNLGQVLGSEVAARIESNLQGTLMYTGGLRLTTPYPKASVRLGIAFGQPTVKGTVSQCVVVTGPGCQSFEIDGTLITGAADIIFHQETALLQRSLVYFIAGLGLRSYSFDEPECGPSGTVCTVMSEFLSNQVKPVGRLGLGYREQFGEAYFFSAEVVDQIGPFDGEGLKAEGGIQNDFYLVATIGWRGW